MQPNLHNTIGQLRACLVLQFLFLTIPDRCVAAYVYLLFTFFLQEGPSRKESGKRGRKPGRKSAEKVDMKAKLGELFTMNSDRGASRRKFAGTFYGLRE